MFSLNVGKEEVFRKAEALRRAWEKDSTALNKKKLRVLKMLLTEKRIADEAGIEEWKWHILWLKLGQLESVQDPGEVNEVLLQAKVGKTLQIPTHSKYWLVEEECLFWMEQSLKSPLSYQGFERYMQVFQLLCDKYGIENPLKQDSEI
ncbi:hypothetical protein Cdeb_01190 [Caldibacillus debilis GB1]|uniref:Uncharacterized protein n=1 Tax=Caldibacillus debilis GB1 TaxID=1339248 RepID=A0A420VDQ7_9BACI|nr:hypothetical protein Cdeb_01190 [Caldibacillus debilis GB1]